MKIKKLIILVNCIFLLFSMNVYAQPEVMPDGGVFDSDYYAENNPDVVAAYGYDKNMLYYHYCNFGRNEGRLPYKGAPDENSRIIMTFTGDCTLGEYKGQSGGGQFKDYYNNYGPDYFFANVKNIFASDDLTFINLEGPLTNYPQVYEKTYPIKGDARNINVIKNASVEVCNLANNHTYDCGENGYTETKQLLSAVGISYCGNGSYAIKKVKNKTVIFLGYNCLSGNPTKQMTVDIANAKAVADIVIVEFHWGIERENYANNQQKAIAHSAIDSGADFVVGTHPHVLQGIENYKGKTICYSLGNFSFGANKNPSDKDTIMYRQEFIINDDGSIRYGSHQIIPCRISSSPSTNNYQPTILVGAEAHRVLSRVAQYSK